MDGRWPIRDTILKTPVGAVVEDEDSDLYPKWPLALSRVSRIYYECV
jgi:hypothetical protein